MKATSRIVWIFLFALFVALHSVHAEETLTVPPCGFTPAVTADSYSGLVEVTVSGTVIIVPPDNGHDGFYGLDGATDPRPTSFRWAPLAKSNCTCLLFHECPTGSFPVSSFALGPYPDFAPDRTYTVVMDLGDGPADRLIFGIPDCGCGDNSGQLTVTIKEASPPVAQVDHYKCYQAKGAGFEPNLVTLEDQFETKETIVRRPSAVCNPVDKNSEGISNPATHLTCFDIRDAKEPSQPRFEQRTVEMQNQFGSQTLRVRRPRSLCVPSAKREIE